MFILEGSSRWQFVNDKFETRDGLAIETSTLQLGLPTLQNPCPTMNEFQITEKVRKYIHHLNYHDTT